MNEGIDGELLAFVRATQNSRKSVRADLAKFRSVSVRSLQRWRSEAEADLALLVANIQDAAVTISELMADGVEDRSTPTYQRALTAEVDRFKNAVFSAEKVRYRHALLTVVLDEKRRRA